MFQSIANAFHSVMDAVQETAAGAVQSVQFATGHAVTPIEYDKGNVTHALRSGKEFMDKTLFGSGYMTTVADAEMAALEKATAPALTVVK